MATSSFQTNLFDYLRVVFQRKFWIVSLTLLSVMVAWCWWWRVPKRYRSQMVMMVWSEDISNPHLPRKLVKKAPLRKVMDMIRQKLEVEKRLQHLACNLRYHVKNQYYAEELQYNPNQLAPQRSKQWADDLYQQLQKSPLHTFDLRSEDWVVATKDLVSSFFGAERETSLALDLEDLAANIDNQSLAVILGAVEEDQGGTLSERVILDVETNEKYIRALRNKLKLDHSVSYRSLRRRAGLELLKNLEAERQSKGAGKFSDRATLELLKEIYSLERLWQLRLYTVVRDFSAGADVGFWVRRLKGGLEVSTVRGNLLTIQYEEALLKVTRPYNRPDNIIPHLVLAVAYAMLESEFRFLEKKGLFETRKFLEDRRKTIEQRLDKLNNELFNFEKLSRLQLSFPEKSRESSGRGKELTPYWDDPFSGTMQHSIHIQRINAYDEELREIDKELADLKEQAKNLQSRIDDPDKRWLEIPKGVIQRRGDPPEVVALKTKLIGLQVEYKKLLRKNTPKHPFVVKVKREMDEIQNALNQNVLPEENEPGIEKRENPEVKAWKRDRDAILDRLKGLRGRRGKVIGYIEDERKKAKDAIQQRREFFGKLAEQKLLQNELKLVQAQEEELQARDKMMTDDFFPVKFEKHTRALKPARHFHPNWGMIFVVAMMVGLLSSAVAVFMLEYTDHSLKTVEDVKRHLGLPVLGTIPEFSFQFHEKVERRRGGGLLLGSQRTPYPQPLDKSEPAPARERQKMRRVKPLGLRTLLIWLAVLGGVAALIYFGARPLVSRIKQYFHSTGNQPQEEKQPEKKSPEASPPPQVPAAKPAPEK